MEETMEKKASVKNGVTRLILVGIAIALELALTIFVFVSALGKYAGILSVLYHLAALIIVLGLCSYDKTSSIKMPWIILIMAAPLLGVSLYLFIGFNGTLRYMGKRYEQVDKMLFPHLKDGSEEANKLKEYNRSVSNISNYIKNYAGFPVYQNTDITYYDDAAIGIEAQKEEMKKAKKFIFMEYHAIEDAESWHAIQEILEEKVKEGVDVRVFYDDMGSIGFITTDFIDRLKKVGIACKVFNPMFPLMSLFLNNRDHRKITIIDGRVGFTGGYNLANEYFNITSPYGHWKDTGIRLEGDAVEALTITFLEMWCAAKDGNIEKVKVEDYIQKENYTSKENGFIQPYAINPMKETRVGEDVYISMVERAQDYIYIMTPYLIITEEMTHALSLAAKRGVDVRIITPGIPDKKLVYQVTRSFYCTLAKHGVRIFEYTPGFCHAKQCISDDVVAICGTINFDYRSLYHHFENGCLFANSQAVLDMKEDFNRTFSECKEVTEAYRGKRPRGRGILELILRLFAPLL